MVKRRKRNNKKIDSIDMTPLIDLTFILLIVFMLTAPVLESSINVDPPKMNASEIQQNPNNRTISVDRENNISYQGEDFSTDTLITRLKNDLAGNEKLTFFIRGDKLLPFGDVVNILAVLKKSGIEKANLITEKEN